MRVGILAGTGGPGGPWAHAANLADALLEREVDVELIALVGEGVRPPVPRRAPVRVVPDPGPGGEHDPVEVRVSHLAAAVASAGPVDVWHAEDPVAARSALRARRPGERVVATVHHVEAVASDVEDELQRESIQDVDARATATRYWTERIESLFGVPVTTIANGVDVSAFRDVGLSREQAGERWGWGGRPVLLGLGGIARRKSSRLLLEAFARARPRLGDRPLLVMLGATGPSPECDVYVRGFHEDMERLGLRACADPAASDDAEVALIGPQPGAEIPILYRAVDALALPSTREGSPLAVLEAAAAGRPSIVSDLPSLRETLRDEREALLVPPGEAAPLVEAMVRVLQDRELAAEIAAAAAVLANGASWRTTAQAHLALYRRVTADA